MALVFVAAGFAFVMGLLAMRRMRRSIREEASFSEARGPAESFPLHTYHAVIQQLKQQKHELQSLQLVERAVPGPRKISVRLCSRIFPPACSFSLRTGWCGQVNASAKQILGFGSPTGMSAAEIFREAN